MTRRAVNSNLTLIRRGEPITADWLNDVAAATERNARLIDEITTEAPEGEDGPSGSTDVTYTETARTTSTVRIEDAADPTVFVDIQRIETVDFQSAAGDTLRLVFNNT